MRPAFACLTALAAFALALPAFADPPHAFTSSASSRSTNTWANRAQIGAILRRIPPRNGSLTRPNALSRSALRRPSFVRRQPLLNRVAAALRVGFRTEHAQQEIAHFVQAEQARHGAPLSALSPRDRVPNYPAFIAEKALTLAQYDRSPAQVRDSFISAGGTVGGVRFAPRRVFVQRWRPVVRGPNGQMIDHPAPTGQVVVVSPGYLETGRDFYAQVDALTQQGHEVVVLDHQWAGYSDGTPGAVDRGYGVALYVAAAAAYADQIAQTEYGSTPGHGVVLTGTSMGAYAGVYGAMVLNAQGRVQLDGPGQMPRGLPAVLQAPYRRATPRLINRAFNVLARVPGVRNIPLPAAGLPHITDDPTAQAVFADNATAGNVRSRASAFASTNEDLDAIAQIDPASLPADSIGRVYVVHSERDTLAHTQESRELVNRLGARGHLEVIPGRDHILSESPTEMRHLFDGIRWATGNATR